MKRAAQDQPFPAETNSLLRGLARTHPYVVALDSSHRIIWLSDDLLRELPSLAPSIGEALATAVAELATARGIHALECQAIEFLRKLDQHGDVAPSLIEIGSGPETERFEVCGFRVDAEADAYFVCTARWLTRSRDHDESTSELATALASPPGAILNRNALERRISELERCIQTLAHDLRSPLSSLLGFSRLLREDWGDELVGNQRRFLDRIEEAGLNMERLLQGMLALSRIGAVPPAKVLMNPGSVLQQVRAELKLRLDAKGIELSIPEHPPPLYGDPTQIYQLFSNLIGNAVAHMDASRDSAGNRSAPGLIQVEISQTADGSLISVEDNGQGIKPEDHDRIFKVFETAGGDIASKTAKGSCGLGLSIVKKVVESHEGQVGIESGRESGARFVVRLPRHVGDSAAF